MHWFWRATIAVAIGLIGYFCFGYFLVGVGVFRGAWLIMAVFISMSIPLGLVFQRILRHRTAADHPRCVQCGYNLTGHAKRLECQDGICPECGTQLTVTAIIKPGQPDEKQVNKINRRLTAIGASVGTAGMIVFASTLMRTGELQRHLWIIAVGVLCFWFPVAIVYWRRTNGPR
jgi:hypothetical protein